MFMARQNSKYVSNMTRFLKSLKVDYPKKAVSNTRGRKKRHPETYIKALEARLNDHACSAESAETFEARYAYAKAYQGLRDADIARKLGVSRELCRRWGCGLNRVSPRLLPGLSELLQVPADWLMLGGEERLQGNSVIGLRVGEEQRDYRDALLGATEPLWGGFDFDPAPLKEQFVETDVCVLSNPLLKKLSRKAGGRWQMIHGNLFWAPWVPIALEEIVGLKKRFWPDATEKIINEAQYEHQSLYAAHREIKRRCSKEGLPYPQRISYYKRVQKQKQLVDQFGLDLSGFFADSKPQTQSSI